jgi:LysR family hydrogen peroxide-inducible transcriptional activator
MGQKELLYITTIARTGNISKAAAELFVAQPSLTRCLQKVEAGLGVQLFSRTAEGLVPTQAGEIYLESAYQILRTYQEMERKLAGAAELRSGRLTVGATTFLASYILPEILSVFHSLYPNVTVNVEEARSSAVEEAIAGGELEVGFLHTPQNNPRIEGTILARERFLLAVPPDDPLSRYSYFQGRGEQKYMDLSMAVNRDFICTYPGQRSRVVMDGIFRRAGFSPRIRYQTRSIQTAMRMAYAGLGVTLVPHSYCTFIDRGASPDFFFLEPGLLPSWELMVATGREVPVSRGASEIIRISREVVPYLYKKDAEEAGVL